MDLKQTEMDIRYLKNLMSRWDGEAHRGDDHDSDLLVHEFEAVSQARGWTGNFEDVLHKLRYEFALKKAWIAFNKDATVQTLAEFTQAAVDAGMGLHWVEILHAGEKSTLVNDILINHDHIVLT